MNTRLRSLVPAAVLGLAMTFSAANAQLMLSGHTTGSFEDLAEANTTVTNAPDGTSALFETGIPVTGSVQSSVAFASQAFVNAGSGDLIHAGIFTITNGRTMIGSGAPTALFHLGVDINSPMLGSLALTDILVHIDHTVNPPGGGGIPDEFSVEFEQPAPILYNGYVIKFNVVFDPMNFTIGEDSSTVVGDLYLSITPVPEPSTYAALGALVLVGVVGYRRFRAGKAASMAAAA